MTMTPDEPDPVVVAWLAGGKLTEIARRFNLTRTEVYERLRDHPARQARWN